jgi:5-hydroxyisourate hydrolase-like protein (transthyretin family)
VVGELIQNPTMRAALLAVLTLPSLLTAQSVVGRVVDARNGVPARGVEVALYRFESLGATSRQRIAWREIKSALTDSVGRFTLSGVVAQRAYKIMVRHPGYDFDNSQSFTFAQGADTVAVEVRLYARDVYNAARLRADSAATRSRFADRVNDGLGVVRTRESIAAERHADVRGALGAIPLVLLVEEWGQPAAMLRRTVADSATCAPMYFINGKSLGGTRASAAAAVFATPIDSLHAIEIYANSTTLPVLYAAGRGGCGVVGIWTRPPN